MLKEENFLVNDGLGVLFSILESKIETLKDEEKRRREKVLLYCFYRTERIDDDTLW